MNLDKRKNLLIIALAAETIFGSYGLLWGQQASVVSVLYLMAGLTFIYSVLVLPAAGLPRFSDIKNEFILKLPIGMMMLILAYITASYWLDMIVIDPDFADMLPIMKVMNERLLHGNWRQAYDPIPEIWNGVLPIYLPAMWLPYAPAVALGVDMRWVTVLSLLLSFFLLLTVIRVKHNRYYGYGQLVIAAILFWWLFSRNEVHGLITMSEEGVVIFYFTLLCLSIISGKAWMMGITASICLLSRYSMIGWLIPCLVYFAVKKDFRRLVIFSVTGIVCFFLMFVIPFGWKALEQMIALPAHYVDFARKIWETSPEVYWLNPGLAKFFGPHHLLALHDTLIVMSLVIPLVFMIFCLIQKKWKWENINLACFKLSLLMFYQFVDVPYGYLFYTSSFVSMMIAALILSPERTDRGIWVVE
jgi:hypothetical protein